MSHGYDAFISYSHANDKPIAAALQSVLQKLGKPWYRRRSLRVFRDDTSLSATPQLWPAIEQALGQSRFFILLASPEAVASKWVNNELAHWLNHNSIDTLFIGVTAGEIAWDDVTGTFLASATTCLPHLLTGKFATEPKWVDLRDYRDRTNLRESKFIELGADFAAAIHGTPKEDLLSSEVRQQRRALTLAWSAAVLLLMLAGMSTWQWRETTASRRIAEQNFGAAKETIDAVVFDMVQGLRDVEGMRAETARRILGRAEAAIEKLGARTANNPDIRHSQSGMYGLFSESYVRLGDYDRAADYARRALDISRDLSAKEPANPLRQHGLAVALDKVAAISKVRGDHSASLAAYREMLEIQRALAKNPPEQLRDASVWRAQMRVAQVGIGSALSALGDMPGALSAFQDALAIARELAENDPNSSERQSELSVSLLLAGHTMKAQGALQDALAINRENVDLSRSLAAGDPGNTAWQRQLSAALHEMGDVLWARGDVGDALAYYREGLNVIRELSTKDFDNAVWQNETSRSLDKIGDLLKAQGDLNAALAAYRERLSIERSFAAKSAADPKWRLGVAVTLNKIGDVLMAQDNPWGESLAVYRESLDNMHRLAGVDHGKAGEFAAQYIPLILEKIGDLLRGKSYLAGSLAAYREGLDIMRGLAEADQKSIQRKQSVLRLSNKLGEVLRSSEEFASARSAHRESLEVARALAANDPSNTEWQTGIASSLVGLALDGDDMRSRLREALAIVKQLQSDGKLTSEQLNWPSMITAALEKDTGRVLFYPVNDEANALGILTGEYIRHGKGKGVVSVSTPDGEILTGTYSIVEGDMAGFGQIYASVHDAGPKEDRTSPGTTSLSGDKGTSMKCEFFNNNMTDRGRGACHSPGGALFRLEY